MWVPLVRVALISLVYWILIFTIHRKKVKILSKKVRDTQANPRYSAKNNVAIRVIATFRPQYL